MAVSPQYDADREHGSNIDCASGQQPTFAAHLRSTLNTIPVYSWYADPSGALTFVNERNADYLGLPKDDPLRFGIAVGAAWDSHIRLLHPDDHEKTRRVWSTCHVRFPLRELMTG
jgi:PAS domain-containing protein